MLRLGFSLPSPTVSGCSLGLLSLDSTQCVVSRRRTKDGGVLGSARARRVPSARSVLSMERRTAEGRGRGSEDDDYDAIVIGSGIGGLVAATQLAVKGARVLVLEKYVIPGGSSGFYERDGFTFNVGSSIMFGFGDKDDWAHLEKPYGSIFLSIPTVLDSSLAPEGHHILHIFTTSDIEDWEGLPRKDYEERKELAADKIIRRLEKKLFPGLQSCIVLKEVAFACKQSGVVSKTCPFYTDYSLYADYILIISLCMLCLVITYAVRVLPLFVPVIRLFITGRHS